MWSVSLVPGALLLCIMVGNLQQASSVMTGWWNLRMVILAPRLNGYIGKVYSSIVIEKHVVFKYLDKRANVAIWKQPVPMVPNVFINNKVKFQTYAFISLKHWD